MTELWSDKSIENVTVEEYSGLMESHVLISDDVKTHLSNCSLEEYLNDAAQGTGNNSLFLQLYIMFRVIFWYNNEKKC